jgi:hypothetical protein
VSDVARIYPNRDRVWKEWSLLELLEATGVMPSGLQRPDEYVNKLAGWVNRLNEIREHLKCSKCDNIMRPNYAYAKFLAAYNITVVSCACGEGHDQNIYLNHCWGCERIIDSRESHLRIEGYYVCILCGSGPRQSEFYRQGDICPKCSTLGMTALNYGNFQCKLCGHVIKPPSHKITGDIEDQSIRLESLKKQLAEIAS